MADAQLDPRASTNLRVNSPGREGLTGTAPANLVEQEWALHKKTKPVNPEGEPHIRVVA